MYQIKKQIRPVLIAQRQSLWSKYVGLRESEIHKNLVMKLALSGKLWPNVSDFWIASFLPIREELFLLPENWDQNGPPWLFPRIDNTASKKLTWFWANSTKGLKKNRHGILEAPPERCFSYTLHDPPLICLLPGLAADKQNFRLGYGGGYYDAFLQEMGSHCLSVLCLPSKSFVFNNLPVTPKDQPVDWVIAPCLDAAGQIVDWWVSDRRSICIS